MKIGIVGNYGHRNLGDEALLLGALVCASEGAGIDYQDIVVLTDDREDTEFRLRDLGCEVRQLRRRYGGRRLRLAPIASDMFRNLRGIDHLVYGGGGLINDSNPTAIPLWCVIQAAARLRGIPASWWSLGIGPLEPCFRWQLARWLLSSSSNVTVRDRDSATLGNRIHGGQFAVVPDLAHALSVNSERSGPQSERVIMLSVIPFRKPGQWFEENETDYEHYCNRIVDVIGRLLSLDSEIRVRLFAVSLIQDSVVIGDILDMIGRDGGGRVDVAEASTVEDLLETLCSANVVVATRLHSLVLATVCGLPAVTIAYQPKVASYSLELEGTDKCFKINDFSPECVVAEVRNILREEPMAREIISTVNTSRRSYLLREALAWRKKIA